MSVPYGAEETRQRLVDAATREFADRGVQAASLLEISRVAGQRNRGAVHYHFGSREGMLVAVVEEQVDFLARRERELLALAGERPGDLASALEALVRPAVELADQGWKGRCYLILMCELVEDAPETMDEDVVAALERAGGYEAYALVEQRLPAMPEAVRHERLSLTTSFILRASADRARSEHRETPGRAQLPTEAFVANLLAMAAGMLSAPVPEVLPDDHAPT